MAEVIEMNPLAGFIPVSVSIPLASALRKSRTMRKRLDWASSLAAGGDQSTLIFTAFSLVLEVYPALERPARSDAIELVRAWGGGRDALVRYAGNAWGPYKRCVANGMADQVEARGIGWLFREHPAGEGKHGFQKAGFAA